MKFFLILTFAAVAVAAPHSKITTLKDLFQGKSNGRIISGSPAKVGQFPWQVAVNYYKGESSFFCGGSLISDRWILTAAHCAKEATQFRIKLGGITYFDQEPGRIEVHSTESVVHPGYNAYLNNDIALVKLPEPVKINHRIRPIKLPKRGQQVGAGEAVTVSGWGRTSDESSISNTLNFVGLTTIANSECDDYYGSWIIISSSLCCKGDPEHSTCKGDSGGPIITIDSNGEATLVGVTSFVHSSGCATGNPSAYVRTESFLDWIHENTGMDV